MGLLARISRIVPLLLILAVVAAVVYLVVAYRRSPARAKEVLIFVFTWLCGIIAAFFGVVLLYALFESNEGVADLGGSFMAVGLIGLAVTRICAYRFIKRNPHYKEKRQEAKVHRRFPWER